MVLIKIAMEKAITTKMEMGLTLLHLEEEIVMTKTLLFIPMRMSIGMMVLIKIAMEKAITTKMEMDLILV